MSRTGQSRHPVPDSLWSGPLLLRALLVAELVAVILALAPGVAGDRWMYLLVASLATSWVTLLTLSVLYLLRHELARFRPLHIAYATLLLLTLSTWFVGGAAVILSPDLRLLTAGNWVPFMFRLSGIALSVGVLGLIMFQNHWRVRELAVRATRAELEALQARIRPHFLFNTLNTGAALVHQRPEEAERLLLDLADLFRAALAGPRQISLEDELSLARRYLEIEALRFGDRLRVRWELPRELPEVTVPALSIQPLVENAIRHGVERMNSGEVEIAVSTTPHTVIVRISNPLPQPGGSAVPGHRVGLNASHVRIEALTGGRGSVQTQVLEGRFIATVRLPVGE